MTIAQITPRHWQPMSPEWGTYRLISTIPGYPQGKRSPRQCPRYLGIVFGLGASVSGLCHTVAALTVVGGRHG